MMNVLCDEQGVLFQQCMRRLRKRSDVLLRRLDEEYSALSNVGAQLKRGEKKKQEARHGTFVCFVRTQSRCRGRRHNRLYPARLTKGDSFFASWLGALMQECSESGLVTRRTSHRAENSGRLPRRRGRRGPPCLVSVPQLVTRESNDGR